MLIVLIHQFVSVNVPPNFNTKRSFMPGNPCCPVLSSAACQQDVSKTVHILTLVQIRDGDGEKKDPIQTRVTAGIGPKRSPGVVGGDGGGLAVHYLTMTAEPFDQSRSILIHSTGSGRRGKFGLHRQHGISVLVAPSWSMKNLEYCRPSQI